jgi:lipopolysaccharide biosynthesis glycosyltransferase
MYAITLIINIIDKNVSKSKITFYCMCDNDVDTPAKELLQNVAKKYNVTIEIINVGNFFANAKEEGIHGRILNKAAYYRLFVLNEKINSNIDKILYLDLDTYINHDISELFNIDMEEHCLGGVIDP